MFTQYGITGARNPLLNLGFNDDGTLFVQTGAVNYRGPTDANGYMVIGSNVRMPVGQQIQFHNALERKTAFVKGDYELTPSLTAYGQFMYVDLTVNTESGGSLTQFPALTTIPVTNPVHPDGPAHDPRLAAAADARRSPGTAAMSAFPTRTGTRTTSVQQYLAGLRGDITDGWTFDVFASYDQSQHNQTMHNAVLKIAGSAPAQRRRRRRFAVRRRLQSVRRCQRPVAVAGLRQPS